MAIPTLSLRKQRDCDHLLKTTPTADDYDTLVEPPFYLELDGHIRGVYTRLPAKDRLRLHGFARSVPLSNTRRTGGLPQLAAVLGFQPRIKMRQDYCRASKLSMDAPKLLHEAESIGQWVEEQFEHYLPVARRAQNAVVDQHVEREWRMQGTSFTTAYLNQNQALQYHRDRGNFGEVFSNLIVLRRGVAGGQLVLPEYRVALPQDDGCMLMFDGANIIHGVTPLRKLHKDGYRTGLVYYATEAMKHCYPYELEMERIAASRTDIEERFR